MKLTIIYLLFFTINLLCYCSGVELYCQKNPLEPKSDFDKLMFQKWQASGVSTPYGASDGVLLRRLYLGLTGKLPSVEQSKQFIAFAEPDKIENIIDKLISSEEFVDYFTMYFMDILRVKSEFPINLWPNAVYGYERIIREFILNDEPYSNFARRLMLSQGSNFRTPEVNFFRASASRSGRGLATVTLLTFLGIDFDKLSTKQQDDLTQLFNHVKYKSTKEWKEEIVYVTYPEKRMLYTMPDGTSIKVNPNLDPRISFCDYMLKQAKVRFAQTVVNRVWFIFFNKPLASNPDYLDSVDKNSDILNFLANEFIANNFSLKKLCRTIVQSVAYKSSAFHHQDTIKAAEVFAAFTPFRLGAEVLDDVLCYITNSKSNFSSVIPEPFSYIPPEHSTVSLADGSINSAFLLLFGRPARDFGMLSERHNSITAKQRQYLFNSSALFNKLWAVGKREDFRKLKYLQKIDYIYLLFYSRYPSSKERQMVSDFLKKYRHMHSIFWILLNTQEFLYQH